MFVIFVNSLIKLHITCKRCDFSIMRSYVIFRICTIINTTRFMNMAAYKHRS